MTLRPFSHFSEADLFVCTKPKNPPCCAWIVTLVFAPLATAIPAKTSAPQTVTASTAAISFLAFNASPRSYRLHHDTNPPRAGRKKVLETKRRGSSPPRGRSRAESDG
jgi:hypothetical protein